jgi:hypothetical protein
MILFIFFCCHKEDYSALRASPFGSACRRSNWLRQFVEPAFCLSGVRIRRAEQPSPRNVVQFF